MGYNDSPIHSARHPLPCYFPPHEKKLSKSPADFPIPKGESLNRPDRSGLLFRTGPKNSRYSKNQMFGFCSIETQTPTWVCLLRTPRLLVVLKGNRKTVCHLEAPNPKKAHPNAGSKTKPPKVRKGSSQPRFVSPKASGSSGHGNSVDEYHPRSGLGVRVSHS